MDGRTFVNVKIQRIQTWRRLTPFAMITEIDITLVFLTKIKKIVVKVGQMVQLVEMKVPMTFADPFPPLNLEKIGKQWPKITPIAQSQ